MTDSRKAFRWDLARRTVEQAEESLIRGNRSDADIAKILRQRAERLAKSTASPETACPREKESEPVAIFRLGEARFGVGLADVAEVMADAKIAAAPGTRTHIAGLVQVRGDIRVVVDLQPLLGLGAGSPDLTTVLFLRRNGRYLGLRVTDVEDIRTIASEDRQAPPPEARCAAWMAEDLTIVLDTAEIFARAIEEF